MKKLVYIIIIITLPIVVFFQYRSYTRFNPPNSFFITATDSVDINYYDPVLLKAYYELVYEIPAFARSNWANNSIDVRYPDEDDTESVKAAVYYNQMLATLKLMEEKLKLSYQLKQEGFNNASIKQIVEKGTSKGDVLTSKWQFLVGTKRGDKNDKTWKLQEFLLDKGYEIPKDGIFDLETENALKDLQLKNNLYPSGIVEENILPFLVNSK